MTKRYLIVVLTVLLGLFMWSCTEPAEDDTTPPDAPANLAYDANLSGDGQIYISWEAPTDDDVLTYHIYRSADSGTFDEIISTSETYYLDIELDYTIEYSYKVSAKDESGNESAFSGMVSLTPVNLYSPDTPSGLEIKAHNIPAEYRTDIELSWEANTETDFSYYKIYRSSTTPLFIPDATTEIDSLDALFYYDEDVVVGNTYHYKIIAYDLGGKGSDPTNVVSDTPLAEPSLISPIGNSTAASTTPTFRWTNVDSALKYKVTVRTSAISGDIWESEITAVSGTENTITYPTSATALNANTQYFWFVSAYSRDTDEVNSYTAADAFRTP